MKLGKTKEGEKLCEDVEELAQEEAQAEGWSCGGIAGCAGVCEEE